MIEQLTEIPITDSLKELNEFLEDEGYEIVEVVELQ